MARHGTVLRPPAREKTADVQDITALHTTPCHMSYLPTSPLVHIIPCPPSDSCDTTVPVPPLRSVPVISRFCPVLGWWTMVDLLASRAAESNAFSVPDRYALWIRAEDGLLVQAVAKHSTSLTSDHRSWSQMLQTQRILHDVFTIVHLMHHHPPPLPPRPHPPHSHIIKVCMTTEMVLLSPHPPRLNPPPSHMYTVYNPTLFYHCYTLCKVFWIWYCGLCVRNVSN
jgi:hypothetical protein